MFDLILGVLEEGFAYAIMALGVYITYKILDFPDLSVDGTFPLGGVVSVVLIIAGVSPVLTLLISFLAGALAGTFTGLIHVKLRVRDLFSGIIMMTALYSINLRIAGSPNVPIFSKETIFENSFLEKFISDKFKPYITVTILLIILLIMKLILDFYLNTKSGYLLRAVGDNSTLVTSLAIDKGKVKIIGLALANGLVALAGAIYCQKSGYFEISMGTGTMTIGLASVIIGTNLFRKASFIKSTSAVIIGSLLYKLCVSIAISFGLENSDLRLITAILFLGILVVSNDRKRKVKSNA
ncbi:MAG: ABC transporter permease [Anaerocolumna aminovalerica]|uniref:ABC transporter permease n=1 Tax=Anaerocolumna aminovalerica TaxID=1527 RepID=UPI00147BE57A|nr:ABC transporter permease [Anaerocolumna aminovalerica]MBU5334541.1 ABC transporter permease [Anaerocolumna aminovalerica]MDU6266604.1 ABC transporter permease [Anaerocolumna aminovalerica]